MRDVLKNVAATENNSKWNNIIKRENLLYSRGNDIRSEFERDYTRIIHSLAFRRMKHKTQVFFSPINDHVCTRMEHVILVESISDTIANYLGLNAKLTKAIAIAHDIGHSPFGHQGEEVLSVISKRDIGKRFWHERNGMEMVDKIILLEDDKQNLQNLNLTYGVKDGIVSHCGEIDENSLKPRDEYINLYDYNFSNQFKPYTWEACVVKIADKIAYLGRDIQDAITTGILDGHLKELREVMNIEENGKINNMEKLVLIVYKALFNLKKFNYKYIYLDERLKPSTEYFNLILNTIYNTLIKYYDDKEHARRMYPEIIVEFENWLKMYWNANRDEKYKNKVVFDIEDKKDFCQAVIYYISGMTDNYAIDTYNKIIRF